MDWEFGVVGTNAWCLLLEVDIDGYGLHIVQGIFLIERKTVVTLVLHNWTLDVSLHGRSTTIRCIILARPYSDIRIATEIVRMLEELLLFREKRWLYHSEISFLHICVHCGSFYLAELTG